jgi:hypothetical protein
VTKGANSWPASIREINDLPREEKLVIYQSLLPNWGFQAFGISPEAYNIHSESIIRLRCPTGSNTVELSVYHPDEDRDPVLYLHMGDTFNYQLIVLMVVVNDLSSPRFDIDVDEQGRPTQLGTRYRNIPEEICAMEHGLAPGQIRRGLRIFRLAVPTFEEFVQSMGHTLFFIEPLFYHNAIVFERYGFAYSHGSQRLQNIHREFQPGGPLHAKLDNSTPFRHSDAWKTILGRSWAIHDSIMERPFTDVQMYKRVGIDAGIQTFPDARWR